MIRFLVYLAIAAGLTYCGATVPLGKRTFFGHVKAIWATGEAQELKQGVKEKAGPAADRVKRGIEKGYEAATQDEPAAGSGSAARKRAPQPAPASP
ncbi:MAG TPA: hypothetical protein VNO30_21835 [Kofleriaceae bacterium]|nr:hypothetical protein [Kofleriaceae bacterium]